MKNIPLDFMTTFIDNIEGRFDVIVKTTLSPKTITEDRYSFDKFAIEPKTGIVFEVSGNRACAISALSCRELIVGKDSFDIAFVMSVFMTKTTWYGHTNLFAKAGLYTRRYLVLHEIFEKQPVVVCRRHGKDEIVDIKIPKIVDKIVDEMHPNNFANITCGNLFVKEKNCSYSLKYSVPIDYQKSNQAKSAILAAYVAVKSLID